MSLTAHAIPTTNHLAVLYTLVALCEKHRVNPIDYRTDVLIRVHISRARRRSTIAHTAGPGSDKQPAERRLTTLNQDQVGSAAATCRTATRHARIVESSDRPVTMGGDATVTLL